MKIDTQEIMLASALSKAISDNVSVIIFLSLFIIFQIYQKVKPFHVPTSVPGPERYPFVGILKFFLDNWDTWPTACYSMSEKFKKTWGGPIPNIGGLSGAYFLIISEENVRYILKDNFDNYVKGRMFHEAFLELLGGGIFAADGETWTTHRKVVSHLFTRNLLRNSADVTMSKINQIIQIFDEKLTTEKSIAIDVQDMFFRMTFDTTSLTVFGMDIDSLQQKTQHPFTIAFDEMQKLVMERFTDPLFEIKRFLQLTKRERRIRELKVILDDFAFDIINAKRRTIDSGHKLGPDLVSRFLEHAKANNEKLTNEELRDIIMNIMLAGRDTTACTLTWSFYELTRHPEVVQKLLDEFNSELGTGENSISYDTVTKLPYTHAVVMEVLRLHPSVPNDNKYAVNDDILPDGTHIPAGSSVAYLPYTMGRSKEIWGDDALEFKPERFLGAKEPSPFKYIVFNAGPRTCLGKPVALTTVKMVLAALLPKFHFEDKLGHTDDIRWTTVMSMKNGFEIEISKKT